MAKQTDPRLTLSVHMDVSALAADIESLYRTQIGRFYRVAFAVVGDREVAWDAVQDGFADAVRGRSGFRGEAPLEAWVWRLVVNAAVRSFRQQRPSTDRIEDDVASSNELDRDSGVRDLVTRLPERQRLVVFLRYYADLDYRTIAEVVGIEVGTVSATLHAALAALRKTLEVPR
jgi:RNA polymerase sigma-70 factor, ECF subfamily